MSTVSAKKSVDGNTGIMLSEFLSKYFPQIHSFAPNQPGGVSFHEEMKLWKEGKMTAAFLKQVGKLVKISTVRGDMNLFLSLKKHSPAILEQIRSNPFLDRSVIYTLPDGKIQGMGTLECGFLKEGAEDKKED